MFVIKKRQVIVTIITVLIAMFTAVGCMDSDSKVSEVIHNDESDTSRIASDDYVQMEGLDDEVNISSEDTDGLNTDEKEENAKAVLAGVNATDDENEDSIYINTSNDSSYFVQAKLDREQARAKQKDILTEMINNNSVEQDKKAECADEMLKIQQKIEKETAVEAMIEAKFFSEVYARIDDETVDVVVNKESLSQKEIAQIEDIVKEKTGFSADKIRISSVKK